ncbi:hypothetical protein R2F61_05265 [Mollicutes bacterium LVI A0078]|nr:hypothetical protein RZE84_05285 [Mollicutes bacterium LVI A0075]WOO90138.1 hypothetical protein R2F61_05265 [Mollicutes bacterium LVI A0078]
MKDNRTQLQYAGDMIVYIGVIIATIVYVISIVGAVLFVNILAGILLIPLLFLQWFIRKNYLVEYSLIWILIGLGFSLVASTFAAIGYALLTVDYFMRANKK